MSGEDTDEEKFFRERYSKEINKKTDADLSDEKRQVSQQAMRTPGRRGEQIKHEEIDKETGKRYWAADAERKKKKKDQP